MLRRISIATAATVLSSPVLCSKDERNRKIVTVAERLKVAYPASPENKKLILRSETKNGVKIFSPLMGNFGLFPTCRIATCEILAPVDEIAQVWMNQELRMEWEKPNCLYSQVIRSPPSEHPINYILSHPSYISPSRDFSFIMDKIPGGIVGLNDFRATVFVSVDAPDETPKSSRAVRAHMNSLLVLEPKSATRTQATYIIEVQDSGWFPSYIVEFVADKYISTLSMLKKELEDAETEEENALSVDEMARLRFQRHQNVAKKLHGTTIVDDVTTTKEDLQNTVKLLEQRLKDLRKTEKSEGLNLSDLKGRVEKDLTKAKERLKSL
eukprot:gene8036-16469_t